jgi:menaquinone-dependent protoporphyrinogen oxidase
MEIGVELCALGFEADVRFVKSIKYYEDLGEYDGFIIGSAIYWSQLTPEFISFIKRYEEVLSRKPTSIFSTCMSMQRDNNMNRKRVGGYMKKAMRKAPAVIPLRMGLFPGVFEFEKNTTPECAIMGSIFALTPLEPGDHRDMAKVRSWTKEVASLI